MGTPVGQVQPCSAEWFDPGDSSLGTVRGEGSAPELTRFTVENTSTYGSSTSMDPPLLVGPYAEPNQASAWKGTRRRAACVSTFMGRTSPRHMSDPDKNRPLCAE